MEHWLNIAQGWCFHYVETSWVICIVNHMTVFHVIETLGLMDNWLGVSIFFNHPGVLLECYDELLNKV